MVEIINHTIFNGISGSRPTERPKYYVLHNDAGSQEMQLCESKTHTMVRGLQRTMMRT